jgi:pimeloyl-ACP methyl ester carboxylesterase
LREHFGIQKMSVIRLSWGSGLAALYADAHRDCAARIVLLTPMTPAKMPYVQQRDKKIDSLIAAADIERLNAIGERVGNDDRLPALWVEQFRIIVGPHLCSLSNTSSTPAKHLKRL